MATTKALLAPAFSTFTSLNEFKHRLRVSLARNVCSFAKPLGRALPTSRPSHAKTTSPTRARASPRPCRSKSLFSNTPLSIRISHRLYGGKRARDCIPVLGVFRLLRLFQDEFPFDFMVVEGILIAPAFSALNLRISLKVDLITEPGQRMKEWEECSHGMRRSHSSRGRMAFSRS